MDNGGFCNGYYPSGSSDDELVDISDVTENFSEDVPPLDLDNRAGKDTGTTEDDINQLQWTRCTFLASF